MGISNGDDLPNKMQRTIYTQECMEGLLQDLLDPSRMTSATKTLKAVLKNPEHLILVANCLESSPHQSVRQMACSVLRERLKSLWPKLNSDLRQKLKTFMLPTILKEPVAAVRSSISSLISLIVKHELPRNSWPEFINWVDLIVQSSNVAHREIGLMLLSSLCEYMPKLLRPLYSSLFSLFSRCFEEKESLLIPFYAIEAITFILPELESTEYNYFETIIIPVVTTVKRLIVNDEDQALKAFDFFDSLFDSEVALEAVNIVPLVHFFLEVASEKSYSIEIRISSLAHIVYLVNNCKKYILKHKLVEPILSIVFPLLAEPYDFDDEEMCPSEYAAELLDSLAVNFAPSLVATPTLHMVSTFSSSPVPENRLAAQLALSSIVEGCSDHLRTQLDSLLPFVSLGLKDTEKKNRKTSCMTIIKFARHLQPEISKYHADILPQILLLLNSSTDDLKEKACIALESFCLNLKDELKLYLPTIMSRLQELLHQSPRTLREAVLYAIGSAATAAKEDFQPFFPPIYNDLLCLMRDTEEENITLRANATDALGAIISALGKNNVNQFIGEILPLANENLLINDPEIDQCTLGLFGSLSAVYQEDFAPQLPSVLSHISRVLHSDGDVQVEEPEDSINLNSSASEEDVETWEDADNPLLSLNKDLYFAKETALNVLSAFAQYLPRSYAPYLHSTLDTILDFTGFSYCVDVQKAAFSTLCQYLECLCVVHFGEEPPMHTWVAGLPLSGALPEDLRQLCYKVMDKIIPALSSSKDIQFVAALLDCLADPLRAVGPGLLEHHLDTWLHFLLSVIRGKAPCQDIELDGEYENKLSIGEFDSFLIENACELISGSAQVLGSSFSTYLPPFKEALFKFCTENSSTAELSTAIATLAEITFGMKESIGPHAPELYNLFVFGLHHSDPDIRVSSIYGLGVLTQYGGSAVRAKFSEVFSLLLPLFSDHQLPNIPDNVCAAVSRMILSDPTLLPLRELLAPLVSSLPLKKDFVENEVVYSALHSLCAHDIPEFYEFSAALVPVFAHILMNIETEVKVCDNKEALLNKIANTAKSLYKRCPQYWQAHLRSSPELAPSEGYKAPFLLVTSDIPSMKENHLPYTQTFYASIYHLVNVGNLCRLKTRASVE
ncbi:uncharacterized protein LOC135120895 [Zophobas morio]|uniref:uncharacterized protein LOC135120895 n=1 Tax=Zophobas morio TaxID=2755281 RepID=UPI003082EFB3